MLNELGLFAGINGIGLGLERAGLSHPVCFVEYDGYCQKVLAKRYPEVPIWDDVKTFNGKEWKGKIDIISGGFPCQDISVAGKGAGIKEGTRSGLWSEFCRIIGEVRPLFSVIENVPMLTVRGGTGVIEDLAEIGYNAEWTIISAAGLGAPHLRKRIFIIAYNGNTNSSNERAIVRVQEGEITKSGGSCSDVGYPEHVGFNASKVTRSTTQGSNNSQTGTKQTGKFKGSSEQYEDVADTGKQGLEGGKRNCRNSERSCQETEQYNGNFVGRRIGRGGGSKHGTNWTTEPNVGRTIDGFSNFLDGFNLTNESHMLLLGYGNAKKEDTGQILQSLRSEVEPQILREEIGRQECVSPQEVLFSYLCKLQAYNSDETRVQLEGKKAPKAGVRGVWTKNKPECSSHQSGHNRQPKREHPDSLQALSRLLALHAETAWVAYRQSDAWPNITHWESGIPRVATGVKARVDRLKCLGNAVVPQCAEYIGRLIMEAIK